MKLIDNKTGREINKGDVVITFRGEPYILDSFEAGRHSGSTGRVYLKDTLDSVDTVAFYPGVINARVEP